MSFTVKVKEELLNLSRFDKSELSAIIKMSGSLGLTGDGLTLSITTENAKIARHIYELIENLYHVQPEIKYHQKTNLRKNRIYNVFVVANVREILNDLQLADSFFGIEMGINPTILEDDDKGRAYLRGAFLATGTIRDPESGKYQLEIFSVYQDHAEDLTNLMRKFILDAKVIEHKNGAVTYLQKAEDIMDFLLVIGAMECKDVFEEIKKTYPDKPKQALAVAKKLKDRSVTGVQVQPSDPEYWEQVYTNLKGGFSKPAAAMEALMLMRDKGESGVPSEIRSILEKVSSQLEETP